MIRRYVGMRLTESAEALVRARRLARMLQGSPVGGHAEADLTRRQRRYDRWRRVWTVLYGWTS